MTIVASQPANWERDQGFTVFQNMLQAHADIDALFACSDLMALGALEAIAAAGRSERIRVVGFDALDDARKAIAAGRMEASVAQSPRDMGRLAVEARRGSSNRSRCRPIRLCHRAGHQGAVTADKWSPRPSWAGLVKPLAGLNGWISTKATWRPLPRPAELAYEVRLGICPGRRHGGHALPAGRSPALRNPRPARCSGCITEPHRAHRWRDTG